MSAFEARKTDMEREWEKEGEGRKDAPQLTLAIQRKTRSVSNGSKSKSNGCPIAQAMRMRTGMTKRATVEGKVVSQKT